jgi:hypothetical protein
MLSEALSVAPAFRNVHRKLQGAQQIKPGGGGCAAPTGAVSNHAEYDPYGWEVLK